MIIYFYTLLPLFFLPIDSSSIRGVNYKNDLVPSVESRSDPVQKDSNSLKIVSNEPFIIQVEVPNSGENSGKGIKEKDTKNKWPTKKSVTKIKSLRRKHRQRRDLELSKIDSDSSSMENMRNATENAIDRMEMLKVLKSHSKKRSRRRRKHDNKNHDSEKRNETSKNDTEPTKENSLQKLLPSEKAPIVKMVYPSTPKTDKRPHKYTLKDLMADRERLEKKIKYIRNMLNTSTTDDLIRVRRKSESDRTANKIAKMFLTLSAVNGLHDRMKSKYDDSDEDDYDDNYRVRDIWEKEREESPSRRSSSSNEERYKVKKWIELLKNKRSSSKTCPCFAKDYEEDGEMFPLEQKLQKNYYFSQRGGSSEESSEGYRDHPKFSRERSFRNNYYSRRNHRGRDDNENKLKTLSSRGIKKLDLPLDDLEMYRSKAKQILQNAEEILDRIKEEEERRLATPNILMSRLKELTSRIQSDPRNNENDLIRKLQKNLGCGAAAKSSDGNSFVENMKSLILGPYEKAKALTDENSKKLSSYLLRNLGALDESDEGKDDDERKEDSNIFFEQVQQKSDDKPFSASLAIENSDAVQKVKDETNQDEQFRKRMQEMIKEQEKILNMYEVPPESEENSHEFPNRAEHKKHKQPKDKNAESTLKGTKKPELDPKKDEIIRQPKEKKTEKFNKHKQKESDSGKADENDENVSKEFPENLKKNLDENEKNIESNITPESGKLNGSMGDKMKAENLKKGLTSENPEGQKKAEEVVAATEDETNSRHTIGAEPESRFDPANFGSLHYHLEDYEDYPRKTYEKSESGEEENLEETKSIEETVSEPRKNLETDSDANSELDKSETVKSSQKNSDFNPDQEETSTVDGKESGEKVEEKMPKMKTLDERNNEDLDDEKTQMSHRVVNNDVDNLKSSGMKVENSKEDYNAGEKEVSSKEQNPKDLLENPNRKKEAEFGEETLGHGRGDLEYEEHSEKVEKHLEKSSEMQEKSDEETGNILKATKNSESGEEMDKNAQDQTLGVTENSQQVNKKTENSEASNETILKSTGNQSEEESDKDFSETYQSSEEPVQSEHKISETPKNNGEDDDKFLQKSKSDRDDSEIENPESLRENDSNEQTSEEGNLENLKAVGPENQSEQDTVTQQSNPDEEIKESEIDYEEKLLKAPRMEEAESLKNENDAMNVEETFKKEEDEETALGAAKSSEEKLKNEEDDISQTVKATSDDQNDENEEKNFLKEENLTGTKGQERAEDSDDVSSAFNKNNSELEEIEEEIMKSENLNRDLSSEKAEENENINENLSDESSLRATMNKNEEGQESSDEMSLKSVKTKEDDNQEAEDENDATLKAVGMEDDDEVSVGGPKPDAVEEKENRSDDRGMEDEDVRATNVSEGIREAEENENQNESEEDPTLKATANENEEEEMNIGSTNENVNKEAEERENTSEGKEDSTLRENLGTDKGSLENFEEETPLRAINVGEEKSEEAEEKENKSLSNEENSEETSLRATNMNQDGGSREAEEKENNASEEKDPTVMMKETPLRATNVGEDKSLESESEEIKSDPTLKSSLNSNEETLENSVETNLKTTSNERKNQEETMEDETPLKSVKDITEKMEETETGSDENSLGQTMDENLESISPKESANDQFSLEDSEESALRAVNLEGDSLREENPKEVKYFENNGGEEAFRTESAEEFSNNIEDDDETPLRSAVIENERPFSEGSEERLRVSSFTDNEIEGENDDEISLKSANPFEHQPKSEEDGNSAEMENQKITTYERNSQEIPPDNLQESHPKKKSLKVPSSIAQIMKDLEGQEKGDVSSIENLSPEKIDHIIDKIDEVEQQNKAIDEVDCRKQCACAEDINTRSRNIGRYEIVKDFLHWMKDLKMNRVLSDD